jgi:hypothetical protein
VGVEIGAGIIIVSPPEFPAHGKSGFEKRRFARCLLPPFFQPSPQTLFSLSCPTATHLSHVDTWSSWTCNSLPFHLLLVLKGRMCYVRVSPTALYLHRNPGKSATGRRGDAPRAGVGRADRRPSNGL